jgi:agmatinase
MFWILVCIIILMLKHSYCIYAYKYLAFAPATGTIEPGGWTSRELLRIIDGLSKAGVKIVGSDVVEFTPVYDNRAETTAIVVTEIIYEILQWMIKVPVSKPQSEANK